MSHQLIVAIGRESGSGGLDIAHALAERLQLPLFDKSILQKAAEDKGVSAETLERYDERPYSPLFCRSVRGISSAPEDCVAQMQFELLRQHANAGESFVVLGRCAEEVLADREGLVSIFVRADLDFRVKRTPLPEEEALDFIKHQDRQRRIWEAYQTRKAMRRLARLGCVWISGVGFALCIIAGCAHAAEIAAVLGGVSLTTFLTGIWL